MSKIELGSNRYGAWTVNELDIEMTNSRGGTQYFHCTCDCGNERSISASSLAKGKSLSCGCMRFEKSINGIERKVNVRKKVYSKQYRQEAKRNHSHWITKVYGAMKNRNKVRFNMELPFSKDDFKDWLFNNYKEKFNRLFNAYIENGFSKDLIPSIDRIDDYKGYSLDNIRLTTWNENNMKGRASEKNKKSMSTVAKNYWSKPVQQVDSNGEIVAEYPSCREAERQTGADSSAISKVCRGLLKTTSGFSWRYA